MTHETDDTPVSYWAFGVGQVGCLFNHQESGYETASAAADAAADLYELTDDQRTALLADKIVYFTGEQRSMNGDLLELYETDEAPSDD